MHAQLTELNGLKGNLGRRCIVMGLISSQVGVCGETGFAVEGFGVECAGALAGLRAQGCAPRSHGLSLEALGAPDCRVVDFTTPKRSWLDQPKAAQSSPRPQQQGSGVCVCVSWLCCCG